MAKPLDRQEESKQEEMDQDTEIAIRLGVRLMNEGGLEQIRKALEQSQDPAQVVGTFLAQLISRIAEELSQRFEFDTGVFLKPGGFLDHMLEYIEVKLDLPSEFSDQVYRQVLEVIKAAAMPSNQAPQNNSGPVPLDQGGM